MIRGDPKRSAMHCNRHGLTGKRRTRTPRQPNEVSDGYGLLLFAMKMSEWINPELHADFIAQQTDALRLCTCPDGWVERFGVDVLISYKTEAALERLKTELCLWALNVDFKFRRVFARFLPKQNAEREAPTMILGDPDTNVE